MNFTRRNFIRTTGSGVVAASLPAVGFGMGENSSTGSKETFRLAVAGFTFAKIDLDQSLVMMKRVGVRYLGVKDFHLPLTSTQESINQTLAKMKSYGVEPYGVGPIYLKTEEAVDQAFNYATMVGVKVLVAVPDISMLPYVEKKVKESDIRVAIHNHGPDLPLYSSADDIWASVKNLDPRIGFCLDIGHTVRLGLDPVTTFLRYRERIFDFHVWDADKAEKAGWCVEAGRGIIDFPGFFKALIKAKYSGTVSLEYAKDMNDPLPGIAESIGYFRGVISALR